jgi:uncharacterized protein (DUF302 family)
MPGYTLARRLHRPFAEAVELVREQLAEQGFGVLTEVDLAATLKEKVGADLLPQVILGACRPSLAYAALQLEPSIAAMLPCNVVVRAIDNHTTVVEAFDPGAMMALAGNDALEEIAADAGRRIGAMLESLTLLDLPVRTDAHDTALRRA